MQSMLDLCMAEFRCSAENGSCERGAFGRHTCRACEASGGAY